MVVKARFVNEVPPSITRKPGRKAGRTAGKYTRVIKTLKANPDRWALVESVQKRSRTVYAQKILRENGLKVSIRKAGGNWYRIYACYITE